MHRVFAALKSSKLIGIAVAATLTMGPWAMPAAHAQSMKETDALSVGVRSALARTGGGRVLSAERIPNGPIGMSRVKIVDPNGRIQVLIIEDPMRSQRNSPFEREESRPNRGRFFRGDAPSVRPLPSRTGPANPSPKPRSRDVQE